jgi:superfamily II DNA or RNA helicase
VISEVSESSQPADELSPTPLPGRTLVTLTSVSEDDLGEEVSLIWEVEPGRAVLASGEIPLVPPVERWDDPGVLGALIDAIRWGSVASADIRTLQAPFRSGIQIKDYQLEPVAKALRMPRVSLLIADDVGLGKTIEAGLVIQEMLLRHRARRVLVVCPAALTTKWHEEMREKFGLTFAILDTAALRELRRSHGLQANPFTVFPRMIISLQWLRSPRVQRLLDEVLADGPSHSGFFDLLVVDEAHHCAPAAPTRRNGGYATDTEQTKAVRRLARASTHRLFLTATPHNGYSESFEALLELVDDRRFARGVPPAPDALREVLVRRLKDSIVDPSGAPEFARRLPPEPLAVEYPDSEREGYELLAAYAAARLGESKRSDMLTLLLKKRFFSSPEAFRLTLERHVETAARSEIREGRELDEFGFDFGDEPDDVIGSDAEATFLLGAGAPRNDDANQALQHLRAWAEEQAAGPDAKAERLLAELDTICRPTGTWNDERVVVFTEYYETLAWLAGILDAHGLGGERLGLLYGGLDEAKREHLKIAFQYPPDRNPLRILLATDAAGEGIDLQNYCCHLINYDIPFNPNRLEQRIGRLDRFGQRRPVHVAHFLPAGWERPDAPRYDQDLEFLSRIARKVAQAEADLGPLNPILARAIEAHLLGRTGFEDPLATSPRASLLGAERDLREQVARLREQLDESVTELHVAPANLERVVDVGLDLAGQPRLARRPDGLFEAPRLNRGWERTLEGIEDPLNPAVRRPLTFDEARATQDVIRLHLGSPLVDQTQRLLRSAVWGEHANLARVSGVVADLPDDVRGDEALVATFARLVVVGGDGARLHEEVFLAARALPRQGRSRRIEIEARRFEALRVAIEAALEPGACEPLPRPLAARLVDAWGEIAPLVEGDLAARASERTAVLTRDLERRQQAELERVDAIVALLRRTLSDAIEGAGPRQLSFADLLEPERRQLEQDREAWRARLEGLDAERERERDAVARRYRGLRPLTFPVAVLFVARPAMT